MSFLDPDNIHMLLSLSKLILRDVSHRVTFLYLQDCEVLSHLSMLITKQMVQTYLLSLDMLLLLSFSFPFCGIPGHLAEKKSAHRPLTLYNKTT